MTITELKEKLRTEEEKYKEFLYEGGKNVIGGLGLEMVKDERSNYGDHDSWINVFKVGDQFFRVSSYYDSNNGRDFYGAEFDIDEVKPVEKTITVYQSI